MSKIFAMRRIFRIFVLLLASTGALQQAVAAPQPSRIQILDGGLDGAAYLAALQITLNPGYMTYWRTPGEAGLPPTFDWSGSENVANVAVSWPAPSRINEAGSIVYGFYDGVTLPLRITPKSANAPVNLKLKLQYGVCKEQCIPAESATEVILSETGSDKVAVRTAMEALPKPVKLEDTSAPLSIHAVRAVEGQTAFTVTIHAPAQEKVQLFAEGPDGWTYSTSVAQPGDTPGSFDVDVTLENAPKGARGATPVRLTARAGTIAVETTVTPPWR